MPLLPAASSSSCHRRRRPRKRGAISIVAASLCTAEKMAFIIRHYLRRQSARRSRPKTRAGCSSIRWSRTADPTTPQPLRCRSTTKPDGGTGISAPTSAPRAAGRWPIRTLTWRFRAARPRISADRARQRRAAALRPYRGRGRSLQAFRPAAGQRHLQELMNDDGTVMKGERVARFAAHPYKLKHVTIADMIAYRQAREKLIERVSTFTARARSGRCRATPTLRRSIPSPTSPSSTTASATAGTC